MNRGIAADRMPCDIKKPASLFINKTSAENKPHQQQRCNISTKITSKRVSKKEQIDHEGQSDQEDQEEKPSLLTLNSLSRSLPCTSKSIIPSAISDKKTSRRTLQINSRRDSTVSVISSQDNRISFKIRKDMLNSQQSPMMGYASVEEHMQATPASMPYTMVNMSQTSGVPHTSGMSHSSYMSHSSGAMPQTMQHSAMSHPGYH